MPIGRPLAEHRRSTSSTGTWSRCRSASRASCTSAAPGVARGYLNRPELTAERFVPDPSRRAGRALYRTGDLARWLPGRRRRVPRPRRRQVKIRGFRIELGEIEAALPRHPRCARRRSIVRGTRAATAPGRPTSSAADGGAPRPRAARAACWTGCPRTWCRPDRAAPRCRSRRTASSTAARCRPPEPPTNRRPAGGRPTPRRQAVAAIWAEVLRRGPRRARTTILRPRRPLAACDACLQGCAGRLRRRPDDPRRLRGADRRLARACSRRAESRGRQRGRPCASQGGSVRPPHQRRAGTVTASVSGNPTAGEAFRFPASFSQQRLWFLDRLEPHGSAYNVPLPLELHGELDPVALGRALNALLSATRLCARRSPRRTASRTRSSTRRRRSTSRSSTSPSTPTPRARRESSRSRRLTPRSISARGRCFAPRLLGSRPKPARGG